MNWNAWVRQIHRWLAIAFTVTVIANFIALAQEGGALLLFTGLYLFVLPYGTKWRSGRPTGGAVLE